MVEVPAMTAAALAARQSTPFRLAGTTRAKIADALAEIGVPERELSMHVSQLRHWIYHRGARVLRNAQHRPAAARNARRTLDAARPTIAAERVSADGTRKRLLRLAPAHARDGRAEIECVYIAESDRGYASPVRTPRGRDILAACGQLKNECEKLCARTRTMLEESLANGRD